MTLWVLLSLLLLLAAFILAWPFLQRYRAHGARGAQDIAFYREQLREVENELTRGLVSKEEGEETKRDIERRALIAVKSAGGNPMSESRDKVRVLGLTIISGWTVIGSVALYFAVGSPELAGTGSSERVAGRTSSIPAQSLQGAIDLSPPGRVGQSRAELADVNTMIAQLAARLESNPDDIDGWKMLGWSQLNTQNFPGAVEAYRRVVELAPQDDEVLSLLGESIVRAAGGRVTVEAQGVFARALAINADNPRAVFFAGMALEQAGQSQAALERWLALYDTAPPDADYLNGLAERIREVADRIGFDVSDRLGPSPTVVTPLTPRGPTQSEMAEAQTMTAEERQQMIEGMVNGLAARLEESPNDPAGWAQLIRSYVVMENDVAARQALADAQRVLADNDRALAQLYVLAAELGLR
ncbi:c-type cytochrome biogenesis protein CcmI [Ruegeria pomeroyi]|nr:c-type cytochrome biogenesis protein CcmI [Ruegeria pomeroyi]MCE8534617.1 c-type cytochrome biogenesis protein CcmI [Ruegeria pomeroyi]